MTNANQTAAVVTPADDREMAMNVYSDVYKDANGIRPRWMRWDGVSTEDIWAAVDALTPSEEEVAADAARADAEAEAWEAREAALDAAEAAEAAEAVEAAQDARWAAVEAQASRKSVARAARKR